MTSVAPDDGVLMLPASTVPEPPVVVVTVVTVVVTVVTVVVSVGLAASVAGDGLGSFSVEKKL